MSTRCSKHRLPASSAIVSLFAFFSYVATSTRHTTAAAVPPPPPPSPPRTRTAVVPSPATHSVIPPVPSATPRHAPPSTARPRQRRTHCHGRLVRPIGVAAARRPSVRQSSEVNRAVRLLVPVVRVPVPLAAHFHTCTHSHTQYILRRTQKNTPPPPRCQCVYSARARVVFSLFSTSACV